MNAAMPALEIVRLTHRYGRNVALDSVSLTVAEGEFLTILGPSGSGKTTLLRVIGGFEIESEVEVLRIGGIDMRGLPANYRPVATVFQHYALFPHMSVIENVEYGLKLRKVPAAERRRQAEDALDLVRLSGKSSRRIHQLSGGERQRVAFARAFVTKPRILLLDEPMGALDEKLRHEMQGEVRALQRTLGTTFVQVTHSREEALTMSDRIVVMNRGRIEQLGTPQAVFERPETRFVADFMGLANIFDGRIAPSGDAVDVDGVRLAGAWTGGGAPTPGAPAFFAVHPRRIRFVAEADGANVLPATVATVLFKGADAEVTCDTPIGPFTAAIEGTPPAVGTALHISFPQDRAVIGPASAETGATPQGRMEQ